MGEGAYQSLDVGTDDWSLLPGVSGLHILYLVFHLHAAREGCFDRKSQLLGFRPVCSQSGHGSSMGVALGPNCRTGWKAPGTETRSMAGNRVLGRSLVRWKSYGQQQSGAQSTGASRGIQFCCVSRSVDYM